MNDEELLERLHLLAERRLSLRPGAATRFRAYIESDVGAKVWRTWKLMLPSGMHRFVHFGWVSGPSENDEELLKLIDRWAESHTSLSDVEPLPERVHPAAFVPPALAELQGSAIAGSRLTRPAASASKLPMKRKALVEKYRNVWPSIESDLSDASRNGLAREALDKTARAWREGPATDWAKSKGKLKSEEVAPLPSVMHRIAR
jgi:hypothetical protein